MVLDKVWDRGNYKLIDCVLITCCLEKIAHSEEEDDARRLCFAPVKNSISLIFYKKK